MEAIAFRAPCWRAMTPSHTVNWYIQTEVMSWSYNAALNKNPQRILQCCSVCVCVCVCVCMCVCMYVSMYVHVFVLDGTIYGFNLSSYGTSSAVSLPFVFLVKTGGNYGTIWPLHTYSMSTAMMTDTNIYWLIKWLNGKAPRMSYNRAVGPGVWPPASCRNTEHTTDFHHLSTTQQRSSEHPAPQPQ